MIINENENILPEQLIASFEMASEGAVWIAFPVPASATVVVYCT